MSISLPLPSFKKILLSGAIVVTLIVSPMIPAQAKEVLTPAEQASIDALIVEKNKRFPREFHSIFLENGLEVLVIHDPSAKLSSASMEVQVGYWNDPAELRGLAHYLEHMLFLGTKKYPDVSEYHQFMARNGGYDNAFTSPDHTNYIFEVNPSALKEALDRFGHFFIDPTFNAEFVKRELGNVDAEYRKNYLLLNRKFMYLGRILSNPAHPHVRAFQGNNESLGYVGEEKLREALIRYHGQNYYAKNMKLTLITSVSFAEVSPWVKEIFSQIAPTPTQEGGSKPPEGTQIWNPAGLPKLVKIKPEGPEYLLNLNFQLPSWHEHLLTSPHSILSQILSRSVEGSLSQILKAKGLITHLQASTDDTNKEGLLEVEFKLTEKGLQNWQAVVQDFFGAIAFLKQSGLSPEFIRALQKQGENNFLFITPKTDPMTAVKYSRRLFDFKPGEIDPVEELLIRVDPKPTLDFLNQVSPDKVVVYLSTPDVQGEGVRSDELYHLTYQVESLKSYIAAWSQTPALEGMSVLQPNPYVAENTALVGKSTPSPEEVVREGSLRVWTQTDHSFGKPNAQMTFEVGVPSDLSPQAVALSQLYLRALKRSNSKWIQPAIEAGLRGQTASAPGGYLVSLEGYSDKLPSFAKEYFEKMAAISLTETEFHSLQEEFLKEIENKKVLEPYRRVGERFSSEVWSLEGQPLELIAKEIPNLTLSQVISFSQGFLKEAVVVRALAYGNITPETAAGIAKQFTSVHRVVPKDGFDAGVQSGARTLVLDKGLPRFNQVAVEGTNHAWFQYYQFGRSSHLLHAALELADQIIPTKFFEELRTRKQLGYIVHGQSRVGRIASGYYFNIQSSKSQQDLTSIAEEWISKIPQILEALPATEFEEIRKAVLEAQDQKPRTFEQKQEELSSGLFTYRGDFEWKRKFVDAIRSVQQDQIIQLFKRGVDPQKSRKLTLLVNGKQGAQSGSMPTLGEEITDVVEFKAKARKWSQ